MGWLTSLIAATPYNDGSDFWYNPISWGNSTQSGAVIGPDTGLNISAVFQAIRLNCETVAKIPLHVYRRVEDGKERAVDHPLYAVLHDRPNARHTSYEYRMIVQAHINLRGNHFSQIVTTGNGQVAALIPLNPDRVMVTRLANYRLGYIYRDENNVKRGLTQDEIFHVRGPLLSGDDAVGVTPLRYARETCGAALTMEAYANRLFKDGALHRGHYTVPGIMTPEQRKQAQDVIKAETAGPSGWHNTLILENGAKFESMGMTAEDAQFILSRKYNVIEIARWFNIQPHLLRDLEKSSYSNHEQESLEFAQVTMLPVFVNFEQAIQRDLIIEPDIFAEFLLDAIARADLKTRYEAYGLAIDRGFMSPNEVRARDNIGNAFAGGEKFRVQQNVALIDDDGNIEPANNPQQGTTRRMDTEHYNQMLVATAQELSNVEARKLRAIFDGDMPEAKRKDEGLRFYDRLASKIEKFLCVSRDTADAFTVDEARKFIIAVETNSGADFIADVERGARDRLLAFVSQNGGHNNAI